MRLQAPPRTSTRRHALPRANFLLLMSALGDVITATSSADVTHQSADVIIDQDVDQTVDFSLWLTFSVQVLLTQFSRRFHFCSLFLHIVSLNG